jgi:multiple sugar transport system substrate-binding protein
MIQEPALNAFAQLNPGLTTEFLPHEGDEKLVALIAAGTAPDVFESGEINIPTMERKKLAKPLDELMVRDRFDLEDFYPNVIDAQRYNGKLMSLTDRFGTQVLTYNRALFRQSGVPEPTAEWTYDQWLDASRRLSRPTVEPPVWGAFMPNWWGPIYDVIWAYGGEIFSEDGSRCVLNSPQSIEAVQFVADLWLRHGAAPPPSYTSQPGQGGGALFQQGRIGSQIDGIWVGPALSKIDGLDWYMVPKPVGPAGRANYLHMAIYAISYNAKNPDAAWEFLKFWTGKGGYDNKGTGWEQGRPARRSLVDHPRAAALTWMNERGLTAAYAQSVSTLRLPRKILDFFPIQGEITSALAKVWAGTESARVAIDSVVPTVNAMLAKAATQ